MLLKLKKSLGQHLLISPGVIAKIAKLAQIKEGEVLVEIGPGTGNLTRELLKYPFKRLYLLEIDKEMVEYLERTITDGRVIILKTDAVNFNFNSLQENQLKVLGNLPYNVASLILENIIYYHQLISEGLFLVQKELAEKWLSGKSWLSIFILTFYDLVYLMSIPPRFFRPPPKVISSLIKIIRNPKAKIPDLPLYKKFLTSLYQNRRKMLRRKIPESLLEKVSIRGDRRAEELDIREVLDLYQLWTKSH
ncbi:MAG: 16S rRNA (adenine(1518)-N(6)/adenine(1519)-N(6))-dimethyltransferase RsmA [Caldimicrobium sp.]|nr:16S rRNA (adenine(1518)-N(6)/adenine(1519)-N(6))-dimethyltransferase RsmA [Caldimicrobium sp.]MCX7874479.1 16S rRNA (adenine(1518)-N(6)/adenine(1519)-N(6))-dimethyltransferase RsmA [Caldimicrobium sp.]MDW8094084.1 16S rRNA (adenine(1518)-N(6)/adenine(1519)-N(6))-dimethyltransferase RsmA [Caldimicrobium sp.]